jgi:exportin-2 (importin alpha re-exporter)
MADLPNLLLGSLNPATRKQAEQSLESYSVQPGFLSHLLRLVLEPSQDRSVRLAGSVYLKNIAKLRWEDVRSTSHHTSNHSHLVITLQDVQPIAEQDKNALRSELVPAMIALSNPTDRSVRAQIAEAVSLIAALDFPTKWPDLIDVWHSFTVFHQLAH